VLDLIPSVSAMILQAKNHTLRSYLDNIDVLVFPLLRWIIASNRSHLRELTAAEKKALVWYGRIFVEMFFFDPILIRTFVYYS